MDLNIYAIQELTKEYPKLTEFEKMSWLSTNKSFKDKLEKTIENKECFYYNTFCTSFIQEKEAIQVKINLKKTSDFNDGFHFFSV
jgi:hypothetical protein